MDNAWSPLYCLVSSDPRSIVRSEKIQWSFKFSGISLRTSASESICKLARAADGQLTVFQQCSQDIQRIFLHRHCVDEKLNYIVCWCALEKTLRYVSEVRCSTRSDLPCSTNRQTPLACCSSPRSSPANCSRCGNNWKLLTTRSLVSWSMICQAVFM